MSNISVVEAMTRILQNNCEKEQEIMQIREDQPACIILTPPER